MFVPYLALTLLLCGALHAQDNREPDPDNQFIYPPLPGPQASNDPSVFEDNLNFTVSIDQAQPWKWITNMTYMSITLNQEGNPDIVRSRVLLGMCVQPTIIPLSDPIVCRMWESGRLLLLGR